MAQAVPSGCGEHIEAPEDNLPENAPVIGVAPSHGPAPAAQLRYSNTNWLVLPDAFVFVITTVEYAVVLPDHGPPAMHAPYE
jgi:hypothetical protein